MSECHTLNRRKFVFSAAGAAACAVFSSHALAQVEEAPMGLRLGPDRGGPAVPENFVGLSYENMQLEDPTFFSPRNRSLIEQFRAIAPRGVLRLGGNTSEFGWWKATPGMSAPQRAESPWKAAGEPTGATVFAITPEAIDNLDGFLKACGWSCIYGLNLGYGTVELDLPEAVYVADRLGPRLEYFQVGNEVDLFKRHLRDPATWNVDAYLEQWLTIARAVQKRLPGVRFGMPDVASDVSWLEEIAARWAAVPNKPPVVCLSHHYYWNGPPSNPQANIENLLKEDPRVVRQGMVAQQAAHAMGANISWRMTEGNTVYRGGKDGLSDAFASALWSAEYLLRLMSLGYAGVNLHGGSGHAQAVSVGGVFHGEALMKDPLVPHPKPFYTPIANEGTLAGAGVNGTMNSTYVLEPVAFGMKFAAAFAGAVMMEAGFEQGAGEASLFAGRKGNEILLAVINKNASRGLRLKVPRIGEITVLSGASLESRAAQLSTRKPTRAEAQGSLEVLPNTAMLLRTTAG